VDVSCFVGRINLEDEDNSHTHHHNHAHHHNHSHHQPKVKLKFTGDDNYTVFSNNDCCVDETTSFYASLSKIIVSQSLELDFPVNLLIPSIYNFELQTIEVEPIEPISICNKAPPPEGRCIYILNETFII